MSAQEWKSIEESRVIEDALNDLVAIAEEVWMENAEHYMEEANIESRFFDTCSLFEDSDIATFAFNVIEFGLNVQDDLYYAAVREEENHIVHCYFAGSEERILEAINKGIAFAIADNQGGAMIDQVD